MSRPAEAALPGFFDDAAREHAMAMASAGEVERSLCFADRRVLLRFAGSGLARALTEALRPRLAEDAAPAYVTIGLWEERAAPGGARAVPWRDVDLGARGLLRGAGRRARPRRARGRLGGGHAG